MAIYMYSEYLPHLWDYLSKNIERNYPLELKPNQVILFGGAYLHHTIPSFREKFPGFEIVIYQAEPLLSENHWWSREHIIDQLRQADAIWEYDYQNAILLNDEYGLNVKYMPLLSIEEEYKNANKVDIDILFFGTLTERRLHTLSLLSNKSIPNFVVLGHIDGDLLDEYIARSKLVINIHAHPDQQQEQTRIAYLLDRGKTVLSEKSKYNIYGDAIIQFNTIEELVESIPSLLQNDFWLNFGKEANLKFKQLDHKKILENISLESEINDVTKK